MTAVEANQQTDSWNWQRVLLAILILLLLSISCVSLAAMLAFRVQPSREISDISLKAQQTADYSVTIDDGTRLAPLLPGIIEEVATDEANLSEEQPATIVAVVSTNTPGAIATLPVGNTATPSMTPEPTVIAVVPTATNTPILNVPPTIAPTSTPTVRPTRTPSPPPPPTMAPSQTPRPTFTPTSLPPTLTPTSVPSRTPSVTPTQTPFIPTNTPTNTPAPPTNTPAPPTNTPAPSTNTPVPSTNTPSPPTNTPTNTPVPPTNTPTVTFTPSPTLTPTVTFTPSPTLTPTNTPIPLDPIVPVLDCVDNGPGNPDFYAAFGFINTNPVTVTLPIGPLNTFDGPQPNLGQPTEFGPGTYNFVFIVSYNTPVTWTLDGTNLTAGTTTSCSGLPTPTPTLTPTFTPTPLP